MPFIPKYWIDKVMEYNRYEKAMITRARMDDGNEGCLFCSKGEDKTTHDEVCKAINEVRSKGSSIIKSNFICTRKIKHKGYHIACGNSKHALFIWK